MGISKGIIHEAKKTTTSNKHGKHRGVLSYHFRGGVEQKKQSSLVVVSKTRLQRE